MNKTLTCHILRK